MMNRHFEVPQLTDDNRQDVDILHFLQLEARRQKETLNLNAAENYAGKAVLEAQGSVLTNKYAEGYPYHRYYAGCSYIDEVENLAIQRAKKLFLATLPLKGLLFSLLTLCSNYVNVTFKARMLSSLIFKQKVILLT